MFVRDFGDHVKESWWAVWVCVVLRWLLSALIDGVDWLCRRPFYPAFMLPFLAIYKNCLSQNYFLLCWSRQAPNEFTVMFTASSLTLRLVNLFCLNSHTNKASSNTPLLHSQLCLEPSAHITSVCFCVGVCLRLVFWPNLAQDGARGIFCSCELISPPCADEWV